MTNAAESVNDSNEDIGGNDNEVTDIQDQSIGNLDVYGEWIDQS